ncbi:MAG: ATP synthase F1 subunit gamma [bacterium]|nr:ATP synthase F1 subunit gamma [bacterium]
MSSSKEIKNRVRSVKNIAQITKAMEAVSATKMRKSQEFAISARPFAVASFKMLKGLLEYASVLPSVLEKREVKKSLICVVSSDKGLAGAFNANVFRKAEELLFGMKKEKKQYVLVTVGKKAKDYFGHRHETMEKTFLGFGDFSEFKDTMPVADSLLEGFLEKRYDEVIVVYTNFRSTLRQDVVKKIILPATKEGLQEIVESISPEKGKFSEQEISEGAETRYSYEYLFEPSPQELLDMLIPLLLRMHMHHIILESNASEHSARMVAMKAASDNAKELIGELQLLYNKARQASITQELTEITAGVEALER